MKEIILDEHYAHSFFDPDASLAVITWKDKATGEEYKHVFESLFAYGDKNNLMADNFITDMRCAREVSPKNRKWFEEVAMVEVKKRGLKRSAVVIEKNMFTRNYLNIILKTTKKFGVKIRFFYSIDDAMSWFKTFE